MNDALAEIERLRTAIRRLAEQDATLSVCDGNVTVTMDATLTDEEREAVETCIADDEAMTHHSRASILRGLLSRIAGGACGEWISQLPQNLRQIRYLD